MTPSPLGEKTLGDPNGAGHGRRVRLAHLPATAAASIRRRSRRVQGEIHRHRQGLFRAPRISARSAGAGRHHGGALRRREGNSSRSSTTLFREQNDWAFVDNPGPALIERLKPARRRPTKPSRRCLDDKKLVEDIIAVERARPGSRSASTARRPSSSTASMHVGEMTIAQVDAMIGTARSLRRRPSG